MFENLAQRLEGRIVVLEPLGPEHAPGLREAAADERIWRWMLTTDFEVWLRYTLGNEAIQPFAVLRDGVVVGSTSYMSLAPEHLRLAIGNERTTEADIRRAWGVLKRESTASAPPS